MSLVAIFSYVLVAPLFLFFVGGSAYTSLPADQFLGVAPEDAVYYKSSDVIRCKDGSKKFTKAELNDDFCDCPDGTDEPGTSACPGAKFYCQNAGHVSTRIFSSRVNDGICDCCDGSDEYDGKVKCPNTCWEAGRVARDRLRKKIATYQEGVVIRKHEVEQARVALVKDEEELATLKNEEKTLKELVERLKVRKEQMEKAEEKEHLQKEKEEKERKEAEEIANKERRKIEEELIHEKGSGEIEQESETEVTERTPIEKNGIGDDSPLDQELGEQSDDLPTESKNGETALDDQPHGYGVIKELGEQSADLPTESKHAETVLDEQPHSVGVIKEDDGPENTEGLSKEELGRLVASRWTGEKIEKESGEESGEENNPEAYEHEEIPQDTHYEDDDGYASETYKEDEKYEYDDPDNDIDEDLGVEDHSDTRIPNHSESDEESDSDTESSLSWLEKIKKAVRNILQAVNFFPSPVDKSESAQVRKEYDELSTKLSKMQSRISSLSKKLKQDFGPEKEFYSFYGNCFEIKQNKYVYKVCPFKQATQEEGYSKTRLGRWNKFEDSYQTMIFSDGDHCWNGPDRSLKVKLRCGLKNVVADVDEPSRCEYEALLSTPAVCSEAKLKELQHKLDLMNQEKPNSHDEL
ncbi:glucosidase 2 subunit beta-like [Punica granatum]|uniref:Glucosidase 2 subunit beta n=2 Tax=Punica granatum TaxID=22663 RepID=A0A218W8V1_PUNGR|nr:glucosidase 2 subunit beta-like [Punica granatum]OWM69297.1 hypothetical protein CDL15_Pgr025484 [Punica granatum]PKI61354.1 hypothetical protein CRG98_018256 [Punica granatum]